MSRFLLSTLFLMLIVSGLFSQTGSKKKEERRKSSLAIAEAFDVRPALEKKGPLTKGTLNFICKASKEDGIAAKDDGKTAQEDMDAVYANVDEAGKIIGWVVKDKNGKQLPGKTIKILQSEISFMAANIDVAMPVANCYYYYIKDGEIRCIEVPCLK